MNLIHEEKVYGRSADHEADQDDVSGFTHLEHDGDKLVSGSAIGQVVAWNFNSGKKLHWIDSQQRIMDLSVKWPLVATCTITYTADDDTKKGVKLFDMEKECLLKSSFTRILIFPPCSYVMREPYIF